MTDNVKRFRGQSKLGLTQVRSIADIPHAMLEVEGECEAWLAELAELEKLGDQRVKVFTDNWREKLEIILAQARACQDVFGASKPVAAAG